MTPPPQPQVPVAESTHHQMHVIAAQPLPDAPAMNNAVICDEVSCDESGVVKRTSQHDLPAVHSALANAISDFDARVFAQFANQCGESCIRPLVVIELIGAEITASHQEAFVHAERRQTTVTVVPHMNDAVVRLD